MHPLACSCHVRPRGIRLTQLYYGFRSVLYVRAPIDVHSYGKKVREYSSNGLWKRYDMLAKHKEVPVDT